MNMYITGGGADPKLNKSATDAGSLHHAPQCPGCSGENLYTVKASSGGPRGPAFLPDIGGFLRTAKFDIVTCADCGLTRFFAEQSARENLPGASRWKPLHASAQETEASKYETQLA